MYQTHKARRYVRGGIEPNGAKSRNTTVGVVRMVPAPGGVAFVEDKPAVEGDRNVFQSNEIENRRDVRDGLV